MDEFPGDASALNDLGYLWAERGEHLQRARRMIEKAVREEPKNAAFQDSLGWVCFQLGQYPRAVAELEKAASLEKPDPEILDHLGEAYRKAGQADKAKEAWRRTVELFRSDGRQDRAKEVETKIHDSGGMPSRGAAAGRHVRWGEDMPTRRFAS